MSKNTSKNLRDLMTIYKENLYHAQKLQKCYPNKYVKPRNYTPSKKSWLNNKYIKTKNRNYKLESKFFSPFRILHSIEKQAYKLELSKKKSIHNVFYVSLLK